MKYIINGGKPLRGSVRVGGAKNASFKLMIAACLANTESRLLNLSEIGDVDSTQKLLEQFNVNISWSGHKTVFINPQNMHGIEMSGDEGSKSRGSTLLAAVLLAKFGRAIIPIPGGCYLGARPIDRHIDAFKSLGVRSFEQGNIITLEVEHLHGGDYRFNKKTHTGTEAMIMLAVKAKGRTVIENAGLEPEIDDLIDFLNSMGAKIRRAPLDKIIIDGVKDLNGAIHKVVPDRNAAVSYAIAALATKGDVVIEDVRIDHIRTFLEKVDQIGGKFNVFNYGIRFWYDTNLKATDIITEPEPGFMTDWQPMWSLLMTQAVGTSRIIESVYSNRLGFVDDLNSMGANIERYQPKVDNPADFYQFNDYSEDGYYGIKIHGATLLQAKNMVVHNVREGATLTIAALIASGTSEITGISHIDRGYERLDKRLEDLGANIETIE